VRTSDRAADGAAVFSVLGLHMDDFYDDTLLNKVKRLQNGLIARATGGQFNDQEYFELRSEFSAIPKIKDRLPDFVKTCSDVDQFWGWVKYEVETYQARRKLIWDGFRSLISYLETESTAPSTEPISEAIIKLDASHIHEIWQKALDRRVDDPEGAITAARTLLESVSKTILNDLKVEFDESSELPKLWSSVSEALNLSPSQHQEQVFKAILGNCQSIVNYLGSLRNKISDAHGQGRMPVKPKPRHAELAVNLAGTMAAFLVATLEEKRKV
jgi:Abortive infection C-terminus